MQKCGEYSVFQISEGYEGYCRDESRATGEASTISFPTSEEEVRATVRQMKKDGTPITVQGGRNGLAAGAVPHGGHVLNLTKMTSFLGLRKEGDTYYVRVRPGAVLSVFNKAVADKALKPCEGKMAQREYVPEPAQPKQDYIEERLPVSVPSFALGYKERIPSPERSVKEVLCTEILLDAIAGKSSALYAHLLEEGLINNGFSNQYFCGFGFADCEFSGESADPARAAQEIRKAVAAVRETGVDETAFEQARRKLYGRMIMRFNEVDDLAIEMAQTYFGGEGLFDSLEACRSVTLQDVNTRLAAILEDDTAALSVILPIEQKEA